MPAKRLIIISGPTGVGKTQVAIDLAKTLQTEIINADSRQVYAELNIGVGRPTVEQLRDVPHHLLGHISIFQPYSVGQYASEAMNIIEGLFEIHDDVIVSGGTGLYIKAITEGLDDFPEVAASINEKWTKAWKESGIDYLKEQLEIMDPGYAREVDLRNPMRLIRALSVGESTGLPFSSFLSRSQKERNFDILPILLELPRKELYQRIEERVDAMMRAGWLDEAKELYRHRELKALNTVGYKELFLYLDGMLILENTILKIKQSTRNYAKRQLTWFRNQGNWQSFHPDDIDGINQFISRQ
jgi:tRNA dimethylallyltransferase